MTYDPTDPARPALVPGHGPSDAEPAFDAAAAASAIQSPNRGPSTIEGDYREPARPLLPPAGVDLPDDLREAMATSDAAYEKWRDAAERVEDYEAEARTSRARRTAAIRAAGVAESNGTKRPSIPKAISEEDEKLEVQILGAVVDARRREADVAATKVSRLTMKYASTFVEPIAERFGPAIADAREALSAALRAVEKAEAVSSRVISLRAMAHATALEDAGARLNRSAVPSLAQSYAAAMQTEHYRLGSAHGRSALHLLADAGRALNDLAATDLAAVPHPDTVGLVGTTDGQTMSVWRKVFDAAGPEQKKKASAFFRR